MSNPNPNQPQKQNQFVTELDMFVGMMRDQTLSSLYKKWKENGDIVLYRKGLYAYIHADLAVAIAKHNPVGAEMQKLTDHLKKSA